MQEELMRMIMASGGFQRSNRFRVEIDLPRVLREEYQEYINEFGLMCIETEIPGFSLDTKTVDKGEVWNRPHSNNMLNVDLRFLIDAKMKIRKMFIDWRNLIVDARTKVVGFHDDYVGQIRIMPTDRSFGYGAIAEIILCEAYPEQVGGVRFSYEDDNKIAMLQVNIKYPYVEETYDQDY